MKPFKKHSLAIIFLLILFISAGILTGPRLLKAALISQLKSIFPQAKVEVGAVLLKPFIYVNVSSIRISREGEYSFTAREAGLRIDPAALVRRSLPKAFIKDVSVEIKTKKTLGECFSGLSFGQEKKGFLVLEELELARIQLRVSSKDLKLQGSLSAVVNLPAQKITSLLLDFPEIEINGCAVKDIHAVVSRPEEDGDLQAAQIVYNKLKAKDIKARFAVADKELFLRSWSARFLNGELTGNVKVSMRPPFTYTVTVATLDLDIEAFVKDFGFAEKFQMDGKVKGDIALEGKEALLTSLKGDLAAVKPGGTLTIKDTGFLESIARNSQQSLSMVIDGFKEYPYSDGVIRLSREGADLICQVELDGKWGKRNFQIVLHDFDLKQLMQYQRFQ